MRSTNVTFRDERMATLLACVPLVLAELAPMLIPRQYWALLGPQWFRLCVPFLLVFAGLIALRRVRAPDTFVVILLGSVMAIFVFLLAGLFTAVFGYSFSKYNPHRVSRLVALSYLYLAAVAVPVTIYSYNIGNRRRREFSDG